MAYVIFVSGTIALLAGFVALTRYESQRGMRVHAVLRDRLDTSVERAAFIMAHVDFAAFVREEVRHAVTRLGHAIAHVSLRVVRAAERLLTRLVRHLRTEHSQDAAPRESTREFVKILSDFKGTLKGTHPEQAAFDIQSVKEDTPE